MALIHRATLSPTKAEIISGWLPTQPWSPGGDGSVELVGSYRFDDPEGRVGLEAHLVRSNDVLLQVPFVYRDEAVDGLEAHLVGTTEHSVLGQRWVYDGLADPVFIGMLAAATLTGTGQAIGMVDNAGRWTLLPTPVHLDGGGWFHGPVPVDGFSTVSDDDTWAVLRNDRLELRVAHRPFAGERPPIGLTARWPGQLEPVIVAEVLDRAEST
jgi:Maltokinase N-terminal cap domain